MSFCAHAPRSSHNCVTENLLRMTAQRLRTIIQGWIACFLGTAWMSTLRMHESAQQGCLFYPLGLIDIYYPGNFVRHNTTGIYPNFKNENGLCSMVDPIKSLHY